MGLPLPDFIANAPKLETGLQLFLQAFFDLDTERSHSLGVTMIPHSRIREYAKDIELDSEDREDLIYFIREMDLAHTKRLTAKNKTKATDGKKKP